MLSSSVQTTMWYYSEQKSCDVMMEATLLLVTKGKGNTKKKKSHNSEGIFFSLSTQTYKRKHKF